MARLTDPAFKYVPACSTDIRKTFARVRREQREAAEAAAKAEAKQRVVPMARKGTAGQG